MQTIYGLLAPKNRIKERGDKEYIPLLKAWQEGEVRKDRERIGGVIKFLEEGKGCE